MKQKSRVLLWKKIALLGKVFQNPSIRKLLEEHFNQEFVRAVENTSNRNTSNGVRNAKRKSEKSSLKKRSSKEQSEHP